MNPEITIILPVYNGMPYLKECIASVVNQKFTNWLLLISDNASTDGTLEYLNTLNHPQIKVFNQSANLGIFGNLNFLVNQIETEFCQIICSDDYFLNENSIENILSFWKQADMQTGFVSFNNKASSYIPEVVTPNRASLCFYLFGNLPGNLSNVSFKTSVIKKLDGFDQNLPYAGDFEFWSRLAHTANLCLSTQKIIFVRRHPNTASNYLNRQGELVKQQTNIANRLYSKALAQYPELKLILKIHGTLAYDTLQRNAAVKEWLKGNRKYLKEVNTAHNQVDYIMPIGLTWLLFFITLGGRVGRVWFVKKVIKNTNQKKPL